MTTSPLSPVRGRWTSTRTPWWTAPSRARFTLSFPRKRPRASAQATLSDTVRMDVEGELIQPENSALVLEDAATVHVSGVHRITDAGSNDPLPDDFGTEWVEPGGRVVATGDGSELDSALINHGTVEADGAALFVMGGLPPTAQPSTGAFVAHGGGRIFLPGGTLGDGSSLAGDIKAFGPLELDGTQVDGPLTSLVETWADGSVHVTDATLGDGGSISGEGEIVVDGVLRADPGAGGAASVSGAQVLGTLRAESGTLRRHRPRHRARSTTASSRAAIRRRRRRRRSTSRPCGTTGPTWCSADRMPRSATAFDGLEQVTVPGSLDLRKGADLATDGDFANVGHVLLSAGSRFVGRWGLSAGSCRDPRDQRAAQRPGHAHRAGTPTAARHPRDPPGRRPPAPVGRTFLVVKAGQPDRLRSSPASCGPASATGRSWRSTSTTVGLGSGSSGAANFPCADPACGVRICVL